MSDRVGLDWLDQPRFGAKEIAEPLGLTERKVRHLINTGQIDVTKLEHTFVTTVRRAMKSMGTEL
jgi:hypothetical protein